MFYSDEKIRGVRDFQRIRRYLSHIYLYGMSSRGDFAEANGGSAKDYDAVMGFLRQMFPVRKDTKSKRSVHFFRRSYHRSGENPTAKAYTFHTMDHETDMLEYLCILSLLRKHPSRIKELVTMVDGLRIHEEALDHKTVENRAQKLRAYGAVNKKKMGYALSPDPLKQLSEGQLQQVADYVRFSAAVTYPRVAGSFLDRTVDQELFSRGLERAEPSPFLLRHNSYHNCLDEELVYQLLALMETHQFIFFDDRCRLPVKIRVDTRLGRWYVLCVDTGGYPCVEKITNIKTVKKASNGKAVPPEFWQQAVDAVAAAFAHTLTSSYWGTPILVRAKLEFSGAPGLRSQFLREIPMGAVAEYPDGEYYEAMVSDPLELKPLLRAYGPYLRVTTAAKKLRQALASDYEKMLCALDTEVPV